MRAIIHHTFGDPVDVLTTVDIATPEPGPGQVRVRTLLSPIHNHDLWTVRGTYGYRPELPARAGTEAVGVVDALGEGVQNLRIGQRVATGSTFGVWAEQFVAPAGALLPVPDEIDDESAAQLVSMPFSAIALLESLNLEAGQWLVQNAANGAVGRLLAQLAGARSIGVVGLVRRSAAVAELAQQGIGAIVATDTDDWRSTVAEVTGGAPLVAGVDSVGGAASGEVLSLLADDGHLVIFGAMGSPVMEVGSGDVIFKQATITGFWGAKVSAQMVPERRLALLGELLTRIGDGLLTLPVAATYPFEEIAAASRANFEPGRTGKVLLRPSSGGTDRSIRRYPQVTAGTGESTVVGGLSARCEPR